MGTGRQSTEALRVPLIKMRPHIYMELYKRNVAKWQTYIFTGFASDPSGHTSHVCDGDGQREAVHEATEPGIARGRGCSSAPPQGAEAGATKPR